MGDSKYIWENEVRDNEIDLQGIVNNANYFIYMAHARHKYLKAIGLDFAKMHKDGFDFLLTHSNVDFKSPLKSGDEFIVTSVLKSNGRIRFDLEQEVIRKSDNKIVVQAVNTVVCIAIATGKPVIPNILKKILEP